MEGLDDIGWMDIKYTSVEGRGHTVAARGLETRIESLKRERKEIIDNKSEETKRYTEGQLTRIRE